MGDLAAEKKEAFMRSLVGRSTEAITLNVVSEDSNGPWTEALTDNYLKLKLHGRHEPNQWLRVQIDSVEDRSLRGSASAASSTASTHYSAKLASHMHMAAPQLISAATTQAAKRRQ